MKELLRVLVENPKLRNDLSKEHVPDPMDQLLFEMMKDFDNNGVDVTWSALKHLLAQHDRTDMIEHLDQRALVEITLGPSFVINSLKEDYNQLKLYELFNNGLNVHIYH